MWIKKCCCIPRCDADGEEAAQSEDDALIQNERQVSETAEVPNEVQLAPMQSVADASPQQEEEITNETVVKHSKKHQVTSNPRKLGRAEAISKAAGIFRRYTSKSDDSTSPKITPAAKIELKVGIKVMPRSKVVKVSAIKATNVSTAFKEIHSDAKLSTASEFGSVQIRTKILPSGVRGRSKKHKVYENSIETVGFSNECLHTLIMKEFMSKQIRFRLYNVFQQKRDVLLGEYVLNVSSLNLEMYSCTINVLMQLHESTCKTAKPPEVIDTHPLLSSIPSSSGQPRGSVKHSFTFTEKMSTLPSKKVVRTFADSAALEDAGEMKSLGSLRILPEKTEDSEGQSTQSPFQLLMGGANERTESVTKLENASEQITQNASNLNDTMVQLRETYKKKYYSWKR